MAAPRGSARALVATLAAMAERKSEQKVRLGGMALANGVLVHGPKAWAVAIRGADGELKVASAHKRFRASELERPFLRGPAKLLESLAMLPEIRRALPEARLPFQRPAVLATMIASATIVRVARDSARLTPAAQELIAGIFAVAPAALALRSSDLAAYHGAEHISIGSYEHGERRAKEHERCGSHLLGPLLATSSVANVLTAKAPPHLRAPARAMGQLGALAVTTEIFGWMVRNPERRLARVLAKPGHELQHRLATAEPTPAQVEVAEAALAACLELERVDD
jgi:uncharacterized protein YqhQ